MLHTLAELRHKPYAEKDDELLTLSFDGTQCWLWAQDDLATMNYIYYRKRRYIFVGTVSSTYFEAQSPQS